VILNFKIWISNSYDVREWLQVLVKEPELREVGEQIVQRYYMAVEGVKTVKGHNVCPFPCCSLPERTLLIHQIRNHK
jgi:hypothetical protein